MDYSNSAVSYGKACCYLTPTVRCLWIANINMEWLLFE